MSKHTIFIWGTGTIAEQIISECSVLEQYDIKGFIDNDKTKVGKIYKNHTVFSPDILREVSPEKIIILSNFFDEIKEQIIKCFPGMEDLIEGKYYFYKEMLLKRYEDSDDEEIQNILEYIKLNGLDVFNYKFKNKYQTMNIDVTFDKTCHMYFVNHHGKKMYFAKLYNTEEKVKAYYKYLLVEQAKESPHRYLTSEFNIREGDIVVDVGTAEGNFALDIIDKVSKIYLIEFDEEWIEALNQTFKDYQDKIVIVKKYITSIDAGKYATLDSLIKEPVNFIKMDIEGNEWDALIGAKEVIGCSDDLKCAICAYHQEFDEILLKDIMGKYGLECSTTNGYMWFPYGKRQNYISTKLQRGIVRGVKSIKGKTIKE